MKTPLVFGTHPSFLAPDMKIHPDYGWMYRFIDKEGIDRDQENQQFRGDLGWQNTTPNLYIRLRNRRSIRHRWRPPPTILPLIIYRKNAQT